jgi:hypothetical protein
MQYSEVRRLIDSSGFPNRLITTLGLNQSSMDEQDIKSLPERYRSLCTDAAELLALGEDEEVLVYSSPGRLMYAGNHAESWAGKSLGAAVNPDILALIRIREDSQVVLYSEGYEKPFHLSLDDLAPRREDRGEATGLIRGAASVLSEAGIALRGFDAYLNSRVLPGGGLNASASFTVLMLHCLAAANGSRGEHPLADRPLEVAEMVKRVEEEYFGEEADMASAVIAWNGGLQVCQNAGEFDASRIEHSAGLFDRRQYIVDSLNAGLGTEEAYRHLHEELRKIHTLGDDDILNPSLLSDFTHEDIVLIHFFRTEEYRIQQMVRALRGGNKARMDFLLQEYFHEYRHILNLVHRKSGNFNDKLELLHSILSIYKQRESVELIHGPFGAGIDSKAFFLIDAARGREFEEIIGNFFDYLSIIPVFPREKGCVRVL